MREDFAVFITTHERPKNQKTLDWLLHSGYTGKYYLVIDDADKAADEYIGRYGPDKVLMFDKLKYWEELDTMCIKRHLAAVLYARQFVEDAADEMGLKAFLVMDDDISGFTARMLRNGKMQRRKSINADGFINAYVSFLTEGGFASICPGTQNLYIQKEKTAEKFPRKGSNAFFRNVAIPIKWKSAMNEDIITCVEYNRVGVMMCTATPICCESQNAGTGKQEGGMHQTYKDMDAFERAFYAVIADPSRCYVKAKKTKSGTAELRIARNWAGGDPCILSEKWRKGW